MLAERENNGDHSIPQYTCNTCKLFFFGFEIKQSQQQSLKCKKWPIALGDQEMKRKANESLVRSKTRNFCNT